MDLDIAHLQSWIGREDSAQDLLTPELARRFAATLDLPLAPGPVAPRLIHLCLAPPVAPLSALGRDGHPARGGFLPPVPLPLRMWAGGAFTFHRDLAVGATVTRQSRIADVVLKDGRSGPLCFVTVNHRLSDADGLAIEERQDLVFRTQSAPGSAVPPGPAAEEGQYRHPVDGSAVVLFRYSAITFNGHRIHYDQPYATGVEGYPGLVVHGPLQATWLYHFASRLRAGKPPRQFVFRNLATVFDTDTLTLHARDDTAAAGLHLWVAAEGGPVAMLAEAQW